MMKPLESEEDEEDEPKGWEAHRPLLSGSDVSGTTCSRRVRFHNGTGGGGRGRVAFMSFLKRQQRRILDLVGKEGTEQKLHPPSPALQAIQEDDSSSLSVAPNKNSGFLQWIQDEMTRHRCYWYRASVIAIGYVFLSTFFNFDTLIEGRTAKSAYTEIYQFVVASPDVGYLDVIGTTHHLCKRYHSTKYEANDLVLSLSSHKAKISASSVSDRSWRKDESLLLARFLVGRKYWKQIVLPNETRPDQTWTTATIYDKQQGTTTAELPIWIDPTLSHYYESHALPPPRISTSSGRTRRISKVRRKKKVTTSSSSSKSFLGVAVTLRTGSNDDDNTQCLEQRLKKWLDHYRDLGIEQFYILDNAGSDGSPIQLASDDIEGVIYIQTQIAYDDYNCHGDVSSPGRDLLDNAILGAANVEWLLMLELDQLIAIPPRHTNGTNNSQVQDLPQLLHSILDDRKKFGKEDNVTAFVFQSNLVGVQNKTDRFDTFLVKTSLANIDTTDKTIQLKPSSYGWMARVNGENSPSCSSSYEESKFVF